MRIWEGFVVYTIGSIGYPCIEILWRGRTHWTMGILGGMCFLCIYISDTYVQKTLCRRALISCACITLLEFFAGLLVNKICKMNVWDYSKQPFNFLGQICLLYVFFWYLLCIPAHILCKLLRQGVFMPLAKNNARKGYRKYELPEQSE